MVLLTLALWSALVMVAGLITGTPWARSFGVIGVVVFFGFAFLLDQQRAHRALRMARREAMWPTPTPIDDWDQADFDWPKRDAA